MPDAGNRPEITVIHVFLMQFSLMAMLSFHIMEIVYIYIFCILIFFWTLQVYNTKT